MFRPDKLRKIVASRKLSQNEFALLINYSPATVSRLLRGKIKPSSHMLEKLKIAFPETSLDYYYDEKK